MYVRSTRLPAHGDVALEEVDLELVDLDHVAARRLGAARHLGAPQLGAHAAAELAQAEAVLGDVVVGADLEPEDLVDLLRLRREHDDRDDALGAEAAADLEAVDARHHDVEDHEVEALAGEGLERLLAVARGDDLVALLLEGEAQQLEDRLLVVDQQDARSGLVHRGSSSGRRRAGGRLVAAGVVGPLRGRDEAPGAEAAPIFVGDGRAAFEVGARVVDGGHRRVDAVVRHTVRRSGRRPCAPC